jgi:hypothetical protein
MTQLNKIHLRYIYNTMLKLLIKIPTRGRSSKFLPLLNEYLSKIENSHTQILVSIDHDDHSMSNSKVVEEIRKAGVIVEKGFSRNKIDAINRDISIYIHNYDILCVTSDDMIPQVKGFDNIIIEQMKKHYPDMDGALFFNDGYTGERLNTLPVMGKKYYQRFNYVYHPSYTSLWADNEYMIQAKRLNKLTYIDQVIIKHEHPANNRAIPSDENYELTEGFYSADNIVYNRRLREGFRI